MMSNGHLEEEEDLVSNRRKIHGLGKLNGRFPITRGQEDVDAMADSFR